VLRSLTRKVSLSSIIVAIVLGISLSFRVGREDPITLPFRLRMFKAIDFPDILYCELVLLYKVLKV
jgi:hypothetical protein